MYIYICIYIYDFLHQHLVLPSDEITNMVVQNNVSSIYFHPINFYARLFKQ